MPGTEVVSKQQTWGGIAGIAVLSMALAYRYFPDILHVESQEQQPVAVTEASQPPPWIAALPNQAALTDDSSKIPGYKGTTLAEGMAMGPPTPVTREIAAQLKRARAAEEQGKVLEPKDKNAVALYRAVLEKDPNNGEARAGLARIGGALRDWAIAAMERNDEAAAQRYVAALDELPHSDTELAALQARLKTLAEVQPLLVSAAALMSENKVMGEGDDNALAVYRKVLAIDSSNKVADQGLAQIEREFLDRALSSAAQDDFAAADSILNDAGAIRPGSVNLQDTRIRIESIRSQRAETVLNQALSALDSGNPDMAEQLAQQAQAISSDLPGLDDFAQRLRNARLYASFKPGQTITDSFVSNAGSGPTLVVVPTGAFVMGSSADEDGHRDNEEPQRRVAISEGFALGQAEVTVGEFREFVRLASYKTDAERLGTGSFYDESSGRMTDKRGISWKTDYHGGRATDSAPVVNVSWNDASAYAAWLSEQTGKSYRLPSEAEFEYVLRAGSQDRFPWGAGNPDKVRGNLTGEGDRSPSKRSWA
ncbi:MAG: SUMF1/EgtB/PvdO family nonheme iron enzyme, partial [Dokdonella sp.]